MAHNITRVNGKDSFMSKRQIPWHNLGTVVEKDVTSAEAIKLAGLDYHVDKAEIYAAIEIYPEMYEYYNKSYITYRTDTNNLFGIVGKNYQVVQNTDAFEFFDKVLGENNICYETAGSLYNGSTVFISAKVPQELVIGGKDVVDQYLLLTNSHDGKSSLKAFFTPVRVVCNNTLQVALGLNNTSTVVSLRHTKNVKQQFDQAYRVLGLIKKSSQVAQEQYDYLYKCKITDKELRKYIENIFPEKESTEEISTRLKNIRQNVLNYTMTGIGQSEIEGTWWWAYNGITGYFQNMNKLNKEELMSKNVLGNNAKIMKNALEVALITANVNV